MVFILSEINMFNLTFRFPGGALFSPSSPLALIPPKHPGLPPGTTIENFGIEPAKRKRLSAEKQRLGAADPNQTSGLGLPKPLSPVIVRRPKLG